MVLTDKDKKNIILQCSAHDFDSIQFTVEDFGDDEFAMSITTLSPQYYTLQREGLLKNLWNRIKLAFSVLFGKDYRLFDIVLSKQDLEEFKEFIKNC